MFFLEIAENEATEDQWLQFGNGYDASQRITVKARRVGGEIPGPSGNFIIFQRGRSTTRYLVYNIVILYIYIYVFSNYKYINIIYIYVCIFIYIYMYI